MRDICRHHIDSFEKWSRRLIDETLREQYGDDYFNYMISETQPLVKNEIKKRVNQRIADNPNRFPRTIDAILIEDIEYFLCRDDLYNSYFRQILEPFFSGPKEIRNVLSRVISIRNKLSHGNLISIHEAEQCLCYTNDFIQTYKKYYESLGREKLYNVPVFIEIQDCLGNTFIRQDSHYVWEISASGYRNPTIQLRSGEQYKLWVTVDSSFTESFYSIKWKVNHNDYLQKPIKTGSGPVIDFTLKNKDVSFALQIIITLTTTRDWHRFHTYDDKIILGLPEVLPPIEDTY